MPATKTDPKPVKSFRLSPGTLKALEELARRRGTSEAEIVTLALDRMHQKETEMARSHDYRYCSECGREYDALAPHQIGKDGIGCWNCNPKEKQEEHRKEEIEIK